MQICEVVDYLHTGFSKPIIHRGINPENILVNEESHKIQIIDYGISQHYHEEEEQPSLKADSRRAFKADVRNDIYSLGKVLDFMMDSNNWADGKVDFPNDIYKEIVNKATDSVPANRYNSVDALIIEFQSASKGNRWINSISEDKRIITIGHFWNALLTLIYIISSACVVYLSTVNEIAFIGSMALGEKIIYCIISIVFVMYPIYFIFLFKPSLRKIIKGMPRLKFFHYFAFAIGCATLVLVFALLAQLF